MYRLLLIGAGAIARHHAAAVLASSLAGTVELHVADVSPDALAGFTAEFPAFTPHGSAEDLLALPVRDGDFVLVATPPFTHRDLVLAALRGGRPVLCEKPLAMTAGEAAEMAEAADSAGLALAGCDVRFLGLPTTERAKHLVRDGSIGLPYHVSFVNKQHRARSGYDYQAESAWFRDPLLSGGGVLMDWGPYDIAVLNHVLGPSRFRVLSAWMTSPRTGGLDHAEAAHAEQHVGASLQLELAGGAVVQVTYERAACTHGEERSVVEVEGSAGAVAWDWLDWMGRAELTMTTDVDGKPVRSVEVLPPEGTGFHARPVERFCGWLAEPAGRTPQEITADSVFNFLCLRAIHDTAATGLPQSVSRKDS